MSEDENWSKSQKIGVIVLLIAVGILFMFILPIIQFNIQENLRFKTFNGTLTDMERNRNWWFGIETPTTYNLVIINGTEEFRVTFPGYDIEEKVFGLLETGTKIKIGDNVTVIYNKYNKSIELQERKWYGKEK